MSASTTPTAGRRGASRALSTLIAVALALTVGSVAVPASAAAQPTGIDISRWQHPSGRGIDWGAVRSAGHSFVIIKATESTDYVNGYYAGDSADARQIGMIQGAYHFARPSRPITADALAEARHFVSVIGSTHEVGVLPPVLDLEESGGLTNAELIAWTHTWLDTVTGLTGRLPIIYTYKNFWSSRMGGTAEFSGFPLWLAYYNDSLGGLVGNWPNWTMWQYSSGGAVPGIAGRVDMNRFNGSIADLAALANGAAVSAFAPTAPFPPVNVVASPRDGGARVTWLPSYNGGARLTSYTVTVQPTGQVFTLGANSPAVTVPGLVNGQPYSFSVTASNSLGTSDPVVVTTVPSVQTTLAVGASASTVWYGDSVTLSARLTRNDTGEPLADRTVFFEGRTSVSGGFAPIATLTTAADGSVAATRSPLRTAQYRFRYAGGDEGASTALWQVRVRAHLVSQLNVATARVGQHLRMFGRVSPARGGYVYRQMLLAGHWTTLDKTPVSRRGTFVFHVVPVLRGIKHYRVTMPANAAFASTTTTIMRLRVR